MVSGSFFDGRDDPGTGKRMRLAQWARDRQSLRHVVYANVLWTVKTLVDRAP